MKNPKKMSAQTKQEKKVMDEKIAKVREVVRNVSSNDIVLALHNFELDVERTIHAFCEGGSEGALGSWETGGQAKKQKKNKGKPAVVAPIVAPVVVRKAVPQATPSSNGYSNGFGHGKAPATLEKETAHPVNASSSSSSKNTGVKNSDQQQTVAKVPKPSAQTNPYTKSNDTHSRTSDNRTEKGSNKAKNELFECLQLIRNKLDAREHELADQLALSPDGARLLFDTSRILQEISLLGEVVYSRNENHIAPVAHHNNILPSAVTNGLVNNNSTSHSSLVSSVGEDSGLGQTSQTSPVQEKNVINQVDNGGIVMQSDAFSSDQLAELQRKIEERLRSQGIDPSILTDIGASGAVAPRKRVPNKNNGNRGDHKPSSNRNPKGQGKMKSLTILE